MDLISHETECKIFVYLRDIGCCMTCSLRFVGTRSLQSFREPILSAKKLEYIVEDNNVVENEEVPCIVCLGILQVVTQKIALENIIHAVAQAGHDDSTFNSALTLPVCLFLREKSVQCALADKFQLDDSQKSVLRLRTQNVKEIWKSKMLSLLESGIGKKMVSSPVPSPLLVEISFTHENDTDEVKSFFRTCGKRIESSIMSRKTMEVTLAEMTKEKFQECYKLPSSTGQNLVTVGPVVCTRSSTFLGGRYAKYSRELSQTPWFINGEKKMETSVQDLICGPMIELTKADSIKFLSSGREDVDVRNVHSGRPFAVELVNPKITIISDEQLAETIRQVNESTKLVKITTKLKFLNTKIADVETNPTEKNLQRKHQGSYGGLQFLEVFHTAYIRVANFERHIRLGVEEYDQLWLLRSDLKRLKEGENEKTKVYRALCTLKNTSKELINLGKLNGLKNVEIIQKTPLRVLHRRPLVPRVRLIHAMRSRWLRDEETKELRERVQKSGIKNTSHIDDLFVLDVKTQAGTYVKEFVHGDFGRTKPSLGDILEGDFDIAALDVTAINLDWP